MERAWPWPRGVALFVLLTVLVNWREERPSARVAQTILSLFIAVLAQYWRRVYVVLVKLPRDIKFLIVYFQLRRYANRTQRENLTVTHSFTQQLLKNPEKTCFYFEGSSWSYQKVDAYSNQVARLFHRKGLRKGDTVALMMANCPEYVCIWLGMAKLGAVTALINYNLRDTAVVHSISIVQSKTVIFSGECADALFSVRDRLSTVHTLYQFDGELREGAEDFQELLSHESDEDPVVSDQPVMSDPVVYVYTSGTTGMPKAAILPHTRFAMGSTTFFLCAAMSPERDVIYSPMPLYHAAAGVYAAGIALMHGVPIVIVRKFSASRFWDDCIRYNATMAQYIGEICRYLVAVPPRPEERQHKVRRFLGNGLQPSLWRTVLQRFNLSEICELYAATEGNIGTINMDNTPGAIGFLPRILPLSVYPIAIVRIDPKTGEPLRNPTTGRCERCEDDETGMIIGRIKDGDPITEFRGYVDRESTQKKVLKDVFLEGDRYFMSGDLVSMDEFGYIYFKDRTGDTYRWKGENVSTTEVESAMTIALNDVKSVTVFGVQVPGNEGRAGMAVIVEPSRQVDLERLARHVLLTLPHYARPLFIRLAKEVPMTGTLKITKEKLQKEGYDVSKLEDPVYFFDSRERVYVPLSQELLEDINNGRVRL